jgi:hypothetical protein
MRARFISIFTVAAVVMAQGEALGSAADVGLPTFRACASAPQMAQLVGELQTHGSPALGTSAAGTVVAERAGSGFAAKTPSGVLVSVDAPSSPKSCAAAATQTVRLAEGGSVPAHDIAAVNAALTYRLSHPWPYGAAHLDDPRTSIMVYERNGRSFVVIYDYKTLHDKGAFTCAGEEYYRVVPETLDVRPYDGCFEGAPPQRVLPRLRNLPG